MKADIKPIYHYGVEQGTEEWLELRSGRATASVFNTFLVQGKWENNFGAGAKTQLLRILEERITGKPRASFKSGGTDYGHEYEPEAVAFYEYTEFKKTKACGFVSRGEWLGASPDNLVGDDGGLEVKCLPTQFMEVLETGTCNDHEKFVIQCQFSLWVTGREWWDLAYYHPDFPDKLKMIVFRIEPDESLFETLKERSDTFIKMAETRLLKYA